MSHIRPPLTKEILHNYKYIQHITKYAVMIRDTICDDIEKGNINCEKQTKYAYKIDEQSPVYRSIMILNTKMSILMDVAEQLQGMFRTVKLRLSIEKR